MKKGFLVLLLVFSQLGWAAPTQYVSDQLEITLRSGAGNQFRIIEMLDSGTRLEVLDTSAEGWSRVRTPQGRVGWVLTRYLMSEPSARSRLEGAEATAAESRGRVEELVQQLAAEREQVTQLQGQLQELSAVNERMEQQLGEAAEGLQLATENQQLKKEVVDLQRQIQDLRNQAERLSDRSRQDWFLAGAGVLLGGIILGWILTRLRWRRRSTWSSGL